MLNVAFNVPYKMRVQHALECREFGQKLTLPQALKWNDPNGLRMTDHFDDRIKSFRNWIEARLRKRALLGLDAP